MSQYYKRDQKITQECYQNILETVREELTLVGAPSLNSQMYTSTVGFLGWARTLKDSRYQVTKICTFLTEEEEHKLVDQLIKNVNLFV